MFPAGQILFQKLAIVPKFQIKCQYGPYHFLVSRLKEAIWSASRPMQKTTTALTDKLTALLGMLVYFIIVGSAMAIEEIPKIKLIGKKTFKGLKSIITLRMRSNV